MYAKHCRPLAQSLGCGFILEVDAFTVPVKSKYPHTFDCSSQVVRAGRSSGPENWNLCRYVRVGDRVFPLALTLQHSSGERSGYAIERGCLRAATVNGWSTQSSGLAYVFFLVVYSRGKDPNTSPSKAQIDMC